MASASKSLLNILHVNNVANVGPTLVAGLNQLGHNAKFLNLHLVAARRSTLVKLGAMPLRLQTMFDINRQVKTMPYDVVHLHFAYLGMLGIIGKYPYFLHCHGSDVRRGLLDPIRRVPTVQSVRKARFVFFSTPDLAPIVRKVRPDATFLPNPIDTDHFQPINRYQNQPLKILIISSLSSVKRVDIAFEAVRLLFRQHRNIFVAAIDYGPHREHYHNNATDVNFIPPVPYQEMVNLINAYDIIIGQFGIGSLGMAELESMACGRPVICYYEHTGFYPEPPPVFSTNSVSGVVEMLCALIENPLLWNNQSEQCRAWIQKYHCYRTIAKELEQIYQVWS